MPSCHLPNPNAWKLSRWGWPRWLYRGSVHTVMQSEAFMGLSVTGGSSALGLYPPAHSKPEPWLPPDLAEQVGVVASVPSVYLLERLNEPVRRRTLRGSVIVCLHCAYSHREDKEEVDESEFLSHQIPFFTGNNLNLSKHCYIQLHRHGFPACLPLTKVTSITFWS